MIEVNHISKRYGAVQALNDVSLRIRRAELFGLIGPDGAGKTSLMRILATLLLPDGGSAAINGVDVVKSYRAIRSSIGYMPGRFSLYQDLTMEENLRFFATIFNASVEKNYDLIRPIYSQIEPFKKRRVGALSGGMKQKLALSCALIHRPSTLILDEPTTGVDAVSRQEFWQMLQTLKSQGITMLVSTPYMDEAAMCDRISFIHNGCLLQTDTPEGIVQRYSGNLYQLKSGDMYGLVTLLRAYPNTASCFTFGEFLHLQMRADGEKEVNDMMQYIVNHGVTDAVLRKIPPSIEDCFIKLLSA
ncbi:MAG: ABC transporter ATP-binding protein [Prevotellaceae bacterium]|jgi:ABC-type multidrug transport system ATPase subunit|nr:ABC transporter ATP-binding protein [Prevotellaceae bacterium]